MLVKNSTKLLRGQIVLCSCRVAGVLRDVKELRDGFGTDYLKAQEIAFEAIIHTMAGLLQDFSLQQ